MASWEEWRKETSNGKQEENGEGPWMPFSSLCHVGELARTATAGAPDTDPARRLGERSKRMDISC